METNDKHYTTTLRLINITRTLDVLDLITTSRTRLLVKVVWCAERYDDGVET